MKIIRCLLFGAVMLVTTSSFSEALYTNGRPFLELKSDVEELQELVAGLNPPSFVVVEETNSDVDITSGATHSVSGSCPSNHGVINLSCTNSVSTVINSDINSSFDTGDFACKFLNISMSDQMNLSLTARALCQEKAAP